jgi:hypothetical protein
MAQVEECLPTKHEAHTSCREGGREGEREERRNRKGGRERNKPGDTGERFGAELMDPQQSLKGPTEEPTVSSPCLKTQHSDSCWASHTTRPSRKNKEDESKNKGQVFAKGHSQVWQPLISARHKRGSFPLTANTLTFPTYYLTNKHHTFSY